jgi:hypothetical protein
VTAKAIGSYFLAVTLPKSFGFVNKPLCCHHPDQPRILLLPGLFGNVSGRMGTLWCHAVEERGGVKVRPQPQPKSKEETTACWTRSKGEVLLDMAFPDL